MSSSGERFAVADTVFGQVLVTLRKQRGLEQGQLAEHSGMSRASLSRLERGEASANLVALQSLANALSMTLVDLVQTYENAVRQLREQGVMVASKKEVNTPDAALGLVGVAALAVLLAAALKSK
ncbi:helix-turn-helix domain-containing protein [Celeribacter ethanolicus]|uniref:helix-turn-helix domain-containing protein n=1 Tax=Celeribacter ethanolicus TaxID=1758178 RepID=UPI00082D684E|nr:helix-turn-helix transcriptional regulator [Celeribacter ethanolicus]